MEKGIQSQLVKSYSKVERENLKLLTPIEKIKSLFSTKIHPPESLKERQYDSNQILIHFKHENKKKASKNAKDDFVKNPEVNLGKKYTPGPCALFYQMNEGKFDKDQEAWYYKQNKEIIGPVSSYNMDKMVFYKKIDEQTRVGFKSIEKFVKFGKIQKIVEDAANK